MNLALHILDLLLFVILHDWVVYLVALSTIHLQGIFKLLTLIKLQRPWTDNDVLNFVSTTSLSRYCSLPLFVELNFVHNWDVSKLRIPVSIDSLLQDIVSYLSFRTTSLLSESIVSHMLEQNRGVLHHSRNVSEICLFCSAFLTHDKLFDLPRYFLFRMFRIELPPWCISTHILLIVHQMAIDLVWRISCHFIQIVIIDQHVYFQDLSMVHWQNILHYLCCHSWNHITMRVQLAASLNNLLARLKRIFNLLNGLQVHRLVLLFRAGEYWSLLLTPHRNTWRLLSQHLLSLFLVGSRWRLVFVK